MSHDISKQQMTTAATPASAALEVARERTIRVLTDRFADDTLSVEEFEARLDQMYKAHSPHELDAILREVETRAPLVAQRAAPATDPYAAEAYESYVPGYDDPAPKRLFAFMSSTRRSGRFMMPRKFEAMSIMGDVNLDLRDVALPGGLVEIDVVAIMSNVEIMVPPGVVVEEMPLSVMSSVENFAVDDGTIPPNAPRIRLTGTALMSNVEVRVGARGLPRKKAWRQGRNGRRPDDGSC